MNLDDLRERIIRTLSESFNIAHNLNELSNKLVGLYQDKPPSREELERILVAYYPQQAGWRTLCDSLMAWAGGVENKWCEHIEESRVRNWYYAHEGMGIPFTDWEICPVRGCHKPRPT